MLKYFTAEDFFHSKCWNKVRLWIYSNEKSQNKAQLGIYSIEKAEIRYGWGLLSASFRYKRKCLKDYPHNLTKYEISMTSISPVYQLFIVNIVNYSLLLLLFIHWTKHFFVLWSWSQKNLKVQRRLILKKKQFIIFFMK